MIKRGLVIGIDAQNIKADAFRLRRLIQKPVTMRFFERCRNGWLRKRLQLEIPCCPPFTAHLLKILNSFRNGSKYSSTTRSFSGMMALSVIVIPSGHTFVQHFVMLQ